MSNKRNLIVNINKRKGLRQIQEALDVCTGGETIKVAKGEYKSFIVTKSNITIKSLSNELDVLIIADD